jgi:hypothetical protein
MTTPNYGWPLIQPTDLVTDLPADFEVFADAVDADLAGLLGGTTGQVLVKNSGTDHDYDFGTDPVSDIVTTAGDVLYGSAADTLVRLGIGTAGQVLQVNTGATAPEWITPSSGGAGDWEYIGNTSGSTVSSFAVSSLTGYKRLYIYCQVTSGSSAQMFARINNTSTANSYKFGEWTFVQNTSTNAFTSMNSNLAFGTNAGSSGTMSSGNTNFYEIYIDDCDNTNGAKFFETNYTIFNSATPAKTHRKSKGIFDNLGAVSTMDFVMSTGDATFNVYAFGAN